MRKQIYIILILSIVLISGCVDNYQKTYAGETFHFRADLSEAQKVNVIPDEQAIVDLLLRENIQKINIAFIPNETENAYYGAASFEIGFKLTVVYHNLFNKTIEMESLPLNTTDQAKLFSSPAEPVILLLGPSQTDQTLVTVSENLITLEGKSFDEEERTYNDLDLATDKMILVLMEE